MANIYRNAKHIVHFQMPYAVVGKLAYLSTEELRLLLFIHSEAQRTSKSDVSLAGETVSRKTGVHPTNLGKARNGLVREKLLTVRKQGRSVVYSVCDPADGKRVPDGWEDASWIDFDSLSADVLQRYFKPILKHCTVNENGLKACCPFPSHDDETPSFSLLLEDGTGGAWQCRGCSRSGKLIDFEEHLSGGAIDRKEAHRRVVDRLRALGVTGSTTGQQDVVFSYYNVDGVLEFETVRPAGLKANTYARQPNPDRPGKYLLGTKGCKPILYRLPEIVEARCVILVEGEPDVECLRKLNLQDAEGLAVAVTTSPFGAGGWKPEYARHLRAKTVILLGDTDKAGSDHMHTVHNSIVGSAKAVRLVHLPSNYRDVSHFLEIQTVSDLISIVGEDWLQPIVEI